MDILFPWEQVLSDVAPSPPAENIFELGKSPIYYAGEIRLVQTIKETEDLLQLVTERPLTHIGFDFEYGYSQPPVLRGRTERFDVSSIEPKLLALTLVEPREQGDVLYRFVVDMRRTEILPALIPVFRVPLPYVAHFAKGDLFCLWKTGLPEPTQLWDTWVCEKALFLGPGHLRYKVPSNADVTAEITAKDEVEAWATLRYSLVDTCRRYDVPMKMASKKVMLQQSFLSHGRDTPFTVEQIAYAAEDAIAVARLYPLQIMEATRKGTLSHLMQVEMPWTVTTARMQWTGFRVDHELVNQVRCDCEKRLPVLEESLRTFGLDNACSNNQVRNFFKQSGLLNLFAGRDGEKFEKRLLKRNADKHPAIPLIAEIRQLRNIHSDGLLDLALLGQDGRMHPEHQQLGTQTGRQTSKNPNILGLPGKLRPLVIPSAGYGIGTVDLCQIEVGVTGAVYGDDKLCELYNTGDVYSAMAQQFYSNELTAVDLAMSGFEFKQAHPNKRGAMKTATLAIIYGTGVDGLSSQLGVSSQKAKQLVARFVAMFPVLSLSMKRSVNCSLRRGYATSVSGLRRYRAYCGNATGWERRWLVNFPVQASAATVFKHAGNRLDRLYSHYSARLLLPIHDEFVFEAPLTHLAEVAEITRWVMCESVQEFFPKLLPRAEVDISRPECWTKEGAGPPFP